LVYLGIVQALVVGKVAVLAGRRRDWERATEYASFGLAILTPALFLVRDYGHTLDSPLIAAYAVAVGLGAVLVSYRIRFDLRFHRLRALAQYAAVVRVPSHRR
jgi:hypothetical protein